jgi:hypothetical protein
MLQLPRIFRANGKDEFSDKSQPAQTSKSCIGVHQVLRKIKKAGTDHLQWFDYRPFFFLL